MLFIQLIGVCIYIYMPACVLCIYIYWYKCTYQTEVALFHYAVTAGAFHILAVHRAPSCIHKEEATRLRVSVRRSRARLLPFSFIELRGWAAGCLQPELLYGEWERERDGWKAKKGKEKEGDLGSSRFRSRQRIATYPLCWATAAATTPRTPLPQPPLCHPAAFDVTTSSI